MCTQPYAGCCGCIVCVCRRLQCACDCAVRHQLAVRRRGWASCVCLPVAAAGHTGTVNCAAPLATAHGVLCTVFCLLYTVHTAYCTLALASQPCSTARAGCGIIGRGCSTASSTADSRLVCPVRQLHSAQHASRSILPISYRSSRCQQPRTRLICVSSVWVSHLLLPPSPCIVWLGAGCAGVVRAPSYMLLPVAMPYPLVCCESANGRKRTR